MFAVVEIGKKQYIVQTGDVLDIQRLKDPSKKITFDKVLLVSNQGKVSIGTPYVDGAKVKADVEGEKKGKKVIVYKYKRRKKYRRKQGHRQKYTTIKITDILSGITKSQTKEKAAKTTEKKSTKKAASKKSVNKKSTTKKTTSKKSTAKKSSPKKSS